ncbi:unnamed protein product [Urochloa humidicola]
MSRHKEPSTPAAAGTAWKGRLRSHHATPQSLLSRRLPSRAKNRNEVEEPQTAKKPAAPKNTWRCGGSRAEETGAARVPRAPPRRSPRLSGRDPEHPIVIEEGIEECEIRDNQSAITALRRSPRFHPADKSLGTQLLPQKPHNRKTPNASGKDKNIKNLRRSQGNAASKAIPRMKNHMEPQPLCSNSQDNPIRQKISDVSCKKKDKKQLNPRHCEVLTRKRKRGTEGRSSPKRQNYQELQSLSLGSKEIANSNETGKVSQKKGKNKKNLTLVVQPKIGDERLMNTEENNEEPSGIERERKQHFHGSDDWTEEQDVALHHAYFSARPSPHFWKRVSKLVPGRSAEECFNRIHADLSTPTPIAPRPRTCKAKYSPLGNFSLSDPELPNLLEPAEGRPRTSKQKTLAAQKTVRHLLQKHSLIDHAHEADHFSIFESSPSALQLNISFEDSPGTPHSCINSGSLPRFSASSSGRKKPFSRLKTKPDEPSPGVLKPVKNVILHEKYIDQLCRREGTKRPRKKTPDSKAADSEQKAGDLKAAKNALILEATDFISHFKKLQANSLAHIIENSEDDDETDSTEGD